MAKQNYNMGMRPKINTEAARRFQEAAQSARLVNRVVHDMNIVVLMVMHDKFDFDVMCLKQLYDLLLEQWDAVENQYVSVAGMEDTLFEELGRPEWLKKGATIEYTQDQTKEGILNERVSAANQAR